MFSEVFFCTLFHLVSSQHGVSASLLIAIHYFLACMLDNLSPAPAKVKLLDHGATLEWNAFALVCAALYRRG